MKMTMVSLPLLVLLGAVGVQGCAGSGAERDGWVAVFDGTTLSGWHVGGKTGHGKGGRWVVEHGAIVGGQDRPGNGGVLLTDKMYGDCEISLEMKNDFGIDSGLFLRCLENGRSYQAMIDYYPKGNLMGIYGEEMGGELEVRNFDFLETPDQIKVRANAAFPCPIAAAEWKTLWKVGEWNELRARIVGNPPLIETWINGRKFMEFQDQKHRLPDQGAIALQVHGTVDSTGKWVRYRNIRIKDLESSSKTKS
jgi:hypothetical protein